MVRTPLLRCLSLAFDEYTSAILDDVQASNVESGKSKIQTMRRTAVAAPYRVGEHWLEDELKSTHSQISKKSLRLQGSGQAYFVCFIYFPQRFDSRCDACNE